MAAVAGILVQEVVRPDVFWYEAATKVDLPFGIFGLVAFQIFAMQWVELLRWQDFRNPGSVDRDPIFSGNALPKHEVRGEGRLEGEGGGRCASQSVSQ